METGTLIYLSLLTLSVVLLLTNQLKVASKMDKLEKEPSNKALKRKANVTVKKGQPKIVPPLEVKEDFEIIVVKETEPTPRKSHHHLTEKEKKELCQYKKDNPKLETKTIAAYYNISTSTVYKIIKND